jgi:hypothetical protein
MPRTLDLLVVLAVAVCVGACGGGQAGVTSQAQSPAWAHQGDNQICGEALAHYMQRAFISPSSSVNVRLRARRTLDAIAAHSVSTEPVCGSRSEAQSMAAMP